MKVVILCGGLGTRLREETECWHRLVMPVGDHCILGHLRKTYGQHGRKDLTRCLGYAGEEVSPVERELLGLVVTDARRVPQLGGNPSTSLSGGLNRLVQAIR